MSTLSLIALATALAAPPLVPAADVAEPDLQAWWREGDLLVGVPTREGRPGVRPLVSLAPLELPRNLDEWTAIGDRCDPAPSATAVLDGESAVATIDGPPERPRLVLRSDGRLLASHAIGRPARVCSLSIVQADTLPGLEIVVAWRQGVPGPDRGTGEAAGGGGEPPGAAPDPVTAAPVGGPPLPEEPNELRGIMVFRIPDTAR